MLHRFPPRLHLDRKGKRRASRWQRRAACQRPASNECPHRSISKRRRMPLRRSTWSDLPVCLQPLRCDFPLLDRQSGTEIGFPPRRPAAVHFLPPRTLGPRSKRNNIFGCDLEPRKTSGQVGFLTLLLKSQKRIPRKVAAPHHVPLSQSLLIAWTLGCFIVLDWERINPPPLLVLLGGQSSVHLPRTDREQLFLDRWA